MSMTKEVADWLIVALVKSAISESPFTMEAIEYVCTRQTYSVDTEITVTLGSSVVGDVSGKIVIRGATATHVRLVLDALSEANTSATELDRTKDALGKVRRKITAIRGVLGGYEGGSNDDGA